MSNLKSLLRLEIFLVMSLISLEEEQVEEVVGFMLCLRRASTTLLPSSPMSSSLPSARTGGTVSGQGCKDILGHAPSYQAGQGKKRFIQ